MSRNCAGFSIVECVVSLLILFILVGIVLGSIAKTYRATAVSDNTMIVNTESSKVLAIIREDLLQTSSNFAGQYAPFIDGGTSELRFRRLNGFSASTGRATYENEYICYNLDTTHHHLYRRRRTLGGSEITGSKQAIGKSVTTFTPVMDTDAGNVTITLTTTEGNTVRDDLATVTRVVVITPFNID